MAIIMFNRNSLTDQKELGNNVSGMYFLLAGLVMVILPHFDHLPVWTSLTCLSLVMWRLLHDLRGFPLPNKYITFLIFLVIVLGVLSQYFTIVGREAGTALLISLICLKLFEIKTLRDISVIVQLAFFAIVVTFLFAQSVFVAASMLIAVVLLISAQISFHHAASLTRFQRYSEISHLRLAVKMVMYAIPMAIVVFIFFPRTGTPLWGLPHDAFDAKTGLSDTMSPGNISNLVDSQAVAFRVKFQSRIPDPARMYWRGPVFWAFDGRIWTAPQLQRKASRKVGLQNTSNQVKYTVTLEPHNNYWLFALDQPGSIPRHAFLSTEMQLLSRKTVTHLMRYHITSYLDYVAPWVQGLPRKRYLQVPPEAAPMARRYIHELIQQNPDKTAIVRSVLKLFSNKKFYYTRKPPRLTGDLTDSFLFKTRRGYCEHYASSFTVLMRLAGIPARVVTGYQGGELNPLSNYLIIRQSDAHAWSEIYLDAKGWVRIDPTAVIPPGNIEDADDVNRIIGESANTRILLDKSWFTVSVKQLSYAWDMVNNRWNQWVIGYSNQDQKSMFEAIGIPEVTWKGLSYALFSTLSIFILLVAKSVFRAQRIRKNATDKVYQQFLNRLRTLHIEKMPSEGALGFSRRVAQIIPMRTTELMHIAELYNQARYGTLKQGGLDELRDAIQSINLKTNR